MTINVALLTQMLTEANRRMDAALPTHEPYVSEDIPVSQRAGFYTPAQRQAALAAIRRDKEASGPPPAPIESPENRQAKVAAGGTT